MKSNKKTLLWEISHSEMKDKSFVFGTMHIRNLEIVEHQKPIFDKILSCEYFACEYNLDDSPSYGNSNVFYIPNGQSLKDLIRPKKFQKLSKILKKSLDFNLESVQHLKPIFITNMISELILKKDTPYALDEYLWQFAKENNRKVTGIETMKEQLEILNKMDMDYPAVELLS